jgi:4-amino-4-deoxy-L-arabinose transferase-like glycosyltransferase
MMLFLERRFALCCVALLAVLAVTQVSSIVQESQTYDEAAHLAEGYSYWKTGEFHMNMWKAHRTLEEPPLGKMLNALPLLFLDTRLPRKDPSWTNAGPWVFGRIFLYENASPADELLLAGRSVTILLSLVLGAAIARWTRKHYGAVAALLALFFYCLDPNIIAHGRYATTDLIATLFIFLTCVAWAEFLTHGNRRTLVLSGTLLGLALAAKYPCLLLVPLLAVLSAVHRWGRWRQSWRADVGSLGVAYAIAALILLTFYAPAWETMEWQPLSNTTLQPTFAGRVFGETLEVPLHPYLVGLWHMIRINSRGLQSYLLGELSPFGWWYYFPVAFAVKTPLAVLLLLGFATWWVATHGVRFDLIALLLPAALYFAWVMTSHIDLGVRHILPVYPAVFILIGVASAQALAAWPPSRWLIAAAVAIQLLEFVHAYPYYVSFFNLGVGGPDRGEYYLLDSNLDWGQDAKRLAAYLQSHGIKEACVSYFGQADLSYYGIKATEVPANAPPLDCVAAISINHLHGLFTDAHRFDWLRGISPTAKVGSSIYIYDLRRQDGWIGANSMRQHD